ncbi:hypothetical protein ACKWTF_004956 [Chironomus riparius]
MFQQKDSSMRTPNVQNYNNGVKHHQQIGNNSAINQTTTENNTNNSKSHHQSKSSFIKFLNPFSSSKSKSQTITDNKKNSDSDQKTNSVKVLKQFWNDQIKTAKSSENLSQKSATIKYFSQSNDSLNDCRRTEKSLTLDSSLRYPLDDFNKFKDANFVRTKKNKLFGGYSECNNQLDPVKVRKYSRPESSNLNDCHFPQVSATGGKIHWAKREDIFTAKVKSPTENTNKNSDSIMSVKTNKTNGSAAAASTSSSSTTNNSNGKTFESKIQENVVNKSSKASRSARSDSMTSSIASSVGSTNSSNTNSASRKISFKTNPSTTSSYMNKKLAANNSGNSNKVAQIAQRFNQMIQQDATILEEVKKRGGFVVHRSGGRVFKIKEEKATTAAPATSCSNSDKGNGSFTKKSINNNSVDDTSAAASDDAISLPSIGKNSTRKRSSLRKRPSIRIMVESPRKDGNGNVLTKRQLYEANVVNKETIVIKPKVPDKSERVLAKTKELKSKKILNEIMKTDATKAVKTNEATSKTSNKELNNNSNTDLNSTINNNSNKKEEDLLPKIDETIEPIKDSTTSKNNFRKIYDKLTFRSTFLYGKKAHNKQEMTLTCTEQKEIIMTEASDSEKKDENEEAAENNKPLNDKQSSNLVSEIDDDFELKPIDLNLNVYFNNENLSNNVIEEKNITSQGPQIVDLEINDVTMESINANNKLENQQQKQAAIEMKPNSSFLFRTQPLTKVDTACDTFIRSMLNENSIPNDVDNIETNLPSKTDLSASTGSVVDDSLSVKVEIQVENDYEIISREDSNDNDIDMLAKMQKKNFECDDIDDKSNNNNAKTGLKNETERIVEIEIEKEEEEEEPVENIYQSLCEVKGSIINGDDTMSVKSYESFENYDEIKQNILDNKINLSDILKCEDDYIFPEAISEIPPELPAPRQKHSIPKISSPILTSTTSNLVQANLSVPKLCNINYELQKSNSCNSTTYERITYDQLPKHSKQQQHQTYQPLPPRNISNSNTNINKNNQQSTENIYDTIKNGDTRSISTDYEKIPELDNNCVDKNIRRKDTQRKQEDCESFDMSDDADNPYKNSKNDTMSIISNCYESISLKQSYSTINQILRHAISTSTLSSEHRINSIYGIGQSLTPPSDRSGGSDNSDEWIDVETEDEAETNDRFIVICKKTKTHRNADWSRLIRQKLDEWDDDSDHHYESLYSIQQQRAALEENLEKDKPLDLDNNHQNYFIKKLDNEDDYSSFESEDEEENLDGKPQSADLNIAKLPDPPQNSTGQVYAFVQRIKNFGSISKNEISKGISKIAKKRSSLGKVPTSKFYETTDIVEEAPTTPTSEIYSPPKTYDSKSISKKSRGLSKLTKLGRNTINKLPTFILNDQYEQSEFRSSNGSKENHESNSSLNKLSNHKGGDFDNDVEYQNQKNNKSFKAKFRKSSSPSIGSSSTSNIYSALSSKTSTFYVTDSLDVDSGIFAVNEKSTNSPDNSNLNLNSSSNPNISCDPKRRSIAAINTSRPVEKPPPPPSERIRRIGTTSWYAECGLFKSGSEQDESEKNEKVTMMSWYQESGLYQTSNNSVASSSGSSGVSTGGECSPCGDENSHSMFLNEPLYQLYTAAKLESISSSEFEPENESDGYEEIHKKDLEAMIISKKPSRPSALQLIEPNQGPSRTLWSEVPEVIQSEILSSLTTNEKRLQEAKFEILTSEASYLKSLNLLKSHFMNHPAFRDPQNLDPQDRKALFSNIIPVQECADRLLCGLESCWQDSIMLSNLAKHIFKHAEKHFHVYISYCENQGRLDRTLKRLKETNIPFKETLDILENDPICCGLTIHSFLMLPMQRITRLPLLIDAVMTKLKSNDEEFDDWKMAMAIANKVVDQCNQAANRCEQAFEMETLSKQIEFQQNVTPFPLIPFNTANTGNNRLTRTLVRRGELTHIIYRGDDAKLTFGKKATVKKNIYCFLFTDVIILTKKKSDESYVVFDYCQRSLLQLSSGDVIPQLPVKDMSTTGKYIIFMSLLENNAGKPVDLVSWMRFLEFLPRK